MVRTTPIEKADQHKSWHKFRRGMCAYCGWFCDDCPLNVATCKCPSDKPKEMSQEERADQLLKLENAGITDSWNE